MPEEHPGQKALRDAAEFRRRYGLFGDGKETRLLAAMSGDTEAMAQHIESGGDLNEMDRRWLAARVRGVEKIERRKLKQRILEMKVLFWIESRIAAGMTKSEAVQDFLNDPEVPKSWGVRTEETIKQYFKNRDRGR